MIGTGCNRRTGDLNLKFADSRLKDLCFQQTSVQVSPVLDSSENKYTNNYDRRKEMPELRAV